MHNKILRTLFTGVLLLTPLSSFTFGMTYDEDCCDFTASIDYLYWNACRSGLDTYIEAETQPILNPGKVHYIDNNWNSGIRLDLGYNCDKSTSLTLRYTHFQTNATQFLDNLEGGATRLHPTIRANFTVNNDASVESEYSLKFNVLDIEFGSWISHQCKTKFRPFTALRFGWIKQDIDTVYIGPSIYEATLAFKQTSDVDSYGVTVGFDFCHNLCNCLNLTGKVAGGAHYGDFSYTTTQFDESLIPPREDLHANGCDCRAIYSSDVEVGLEYEFCGFCGSDLTFSLGYELHTWHNLMDFQEFQSSTLYSKLMRDDSSLLLHGLFVRLGMEF